MENSYTLDSDDNVGYLRIEIPRNVADELEKGNLFLSGHISSKGANFQVHLERGREHLVWSLEDASSLLESEQAILTPEGGPSVPTKPKASAKGKEPEKKKYSPRNAYIPPVRQPKKTVEQVESELREKLGMPRHPELISMDWNTARHVVETKGLNWHRKQGILNQHAVDSLVKQDFYRDEDYDFAARCFYVASNLGNERAVARIASQGRLCVPGATSLADWWGKASSFQKLLILTQAKKIDIHKVNHTRLTLIDCPFGDADLGEDSD